MHLYHRGSIFLSCGPFLVVVEPTCTPFACFFISLRDRLRALKLIYIYCHSEEEDNNLIYYFLILFKAIHHHNMLLMH